MSPSLERLPFNVATVLAGKLWFEPALATGVEFVVVMVTVDGGLLMKPLLAINCRI